MRDGGGPLLVAALSKACVWRAETFWEKEPDTIRWLDGIGPGDVLWDVGANIGLYSLYAARRGAKVVAFEPMIPNLYALFTNVGINGMTGSIDIVPAALSDRGGMVTMYLSSVGIGSSCHSAGESVDFNLNAKQFPAKHLAQLLVGREIFSMFPWPTHVKIDVDGFEHRVLEGLRGHPTIRSMIVELNSALPEHMAAIAVLQAENWTYDPAQWAGAQRKEGPFKGTGECIFTRSVA